MKRTTQNILSSKSTRLSLNSEKVRVLTTSELLVVAGGKGLCRPVTCSTITDTTAG